PIVSTTRTRASRYLAERKPALQRLLARLAAHRGREGLYWTEQDSQDENRIGLYGTYDNALVWRSWASSPRAIPFSAAPINGCIRRISNTRRPASRTGCR